MKAARKEQPWQLDFLSLELNSLLLWRALRTNVVTVSYWLLVSIFWRCHPLQKLKNQWFVKKNQLFYISRRWAGEWSPTFWHFSPASRSLSWLGNVEAKVGSCHGFLPSPSQETGKNKKNLFGHFLDSIGVALFTNIESDQEISYYSVTPVTRCLSRLSQLVAKEDFVSIPQPGSLFVQSLKMKSNFQLSKECVSMSAFPPNKICIKPIHTDVYVSGVIKK